MADTRRRKREQPVALSVDEIPGKQLACRHHHLWPSESMTDSGAVPRGFEAVLRDRAADLWWVIDVCPRCGKTRYQRWPNRRYDGTGWHYIDSSTWVRFVEKFSSADAFQANMARNMAKVFGSEDEQ